MAGMGKFWGGFTPSGGGPQTPIPPPPPGPRGEKGGGREGRELRNRVVGGKVLGFRIDECPGCGGMWLDRGELRRISEDRDLERLVRDYASPARKPIQCLRDGSPMKSRTIADVAIDVCG